MGSPGHAFIAHTKALSPRAQSKDAGYGSPPHPQTIRSGQLYWPRTATRREVVIVKRVDQKHAVVARHGRRQAPFRVTLRRLMAVRADGQGRYYQFQGFAPRRYETRAYVWSLDEEEALLCLPEWHPRRGVRLPARLLPSEARQRGAWLRAKCDLSASSAGRLQVSDLVSSSGPEPGSLAMPALDPLPDHR
jgi:hypothetical protein